MSRILLITITILSLFYIFRLIKNKFKDEKRKEVLLLQKIIFTLCIIEFLSGALILYIPIIFFIIILFFSPESISKYIR